ncbi:MAG: MFS transporter [Candidatus Rokubacteria bacterium]|nr:MFS transporter [Candidatus Rokubacteria bacterium]
MPAARGHRSAVAAGFTILFVSTGVNLSFGILFKPILGEFAWNRSTLALAATASLAVNALGQPLFGALIDRFGPRRIILPSMALMALGTALIALAERPWHVILLYGVVAGVGNTGSGMLPVSVHISRWFPRERGFVMAVAASGFSLGHLVLTQVAARAALAEGWRRTYLLMAAILAGFFALTVAWLRDAPRPGAKSDGPEASPSPAGSLDRSPAPDPREPDASGGRPARISDLPSAPDLREPNASGGRPARISDRPSAPDPREPNASGGRPARTRPDRVAPRPRPDVRPAIGVALFPARGP